MGKDTVNWLTFAYDEHSLKASVFGAFDTFHSWYVLFYLLAFLCYKKFIMFSL